MTATEVLIGQEPVDTKPVEGDSRFWSVTTIIGVLDKPALQYWAANETAAAAVRDVEAWQAIERSSGTDEAKRWIAGARYRTPRGERTAKDLGTAVHEACEKYALTGKVPELDDETRPFFEQFDGWLQKFSPVYQATEVTVYSPTYGYAGTCDGFFTIDGERLIFDLKTSKKSYDGRGNPTPIYPETALQLAAYRYAELAAVWRPRRFEEFRRRYYLLSHAEANEALPVPEVDGGLAIKITPEHCIGYTMRCGEAVHRSFLYAIEMARWQFEQSKHAVGDPLEREDAA